MLVSLRDSCIWKLGEYAWSQFEARANDLFLPDSADCHVDFANYPATPASGQQFAVKATSPQLFQKLSNAQDLRTALDVGHE